MVLRAEVAHKWQEELLGAGVVALVKWEALSEEAMLVQANRAAVEEGGDGTEEEEDMALNPLDTEVVVEVVLVLSVGLQVLHFPMAEKVELAQDRAHLL
jgi:hypothetical protein